MIYAFIRYYVAWRKERRRNQSYEYYVTNALKAISENTARQGGTYMVARFADQFIEEKKPAHTSQEIAGDIITRLRA